MPAHACNAKRNIFGQLRYVLEKLTDSKLSRRRWTWNGMRRKAVTSSHRHGCNGGLRVQYYTTLLWISHVGYWIT